MSRFLAILALLASPSLARAEPVSVAAAISLKDGLGEIARQYQAETGRKVEFVFGSSGQLMTQIRNGAPIDLFISAANQQMDELAKEKLIDEASRQVIATNTLVLIVPADARAVPRDFADLADARFKRIAIGQPKTVPAGMYAMQALQALKLDAALRDRLVYGANARQVLAYVERGEVEAGIAYATDAIESGNKVKVAATADAKLHDPIVYPAAVIKGSKRADAARKFMEYLGTEKARKILDARGFEPPPEAR